MAQTIKQNTDAISNPGKLGSRLSMWQNALNKQQNIKATQKQKPRRHTISGPKKVIKIWKPTNDAPQNHSNGKIKPKTTRRNTMIDVWENKNKTKTAQIQITHCPKKVTKTWNPINTTNNKPQKSHNTKQHTIDAQRLKQFIHSGEKYFKILINLIPLYKDTRFQMKSEQFDVVKDDVVCGTYITNKIVLFGEPYNVYCDSNNVEPVDIDHYTYLNIRKQKHVQNEQFTENINSIEQQLAEMANKHQNVEGYEYKQEDQSMLTCDVHEVITPQIPQEPIQNCRAYFTGVYMGCDCNCRNGYGIPYKIDQFSEYVGAGSYPSNKEAFPKAVASTFDGIAIDHNTRVILWEKENFEGEILLDQVGPALINNIYAVQDGYPNLLEYVFDDVNVQNNFPPNTRKWSKSNMHQWSYGSVKVVGANQNV